MSYNHQSWTRLEFNDVPIYVRGDNPCWFVPNKAGDQVLLKVAQDPMAEGSLIAKKFLERLPDHDARQYNGRAKLLETNNIREFWFHVTNRCNLTCRHCLFGSSPGDTVELPAKRILELSEEAVDLGCRLFALTGGEPLIHKDIKVIIDGLLSHKDTHLAMLTNGLLLRRFLESGKWDFDRFHFQISLDGLGERHDRIRGKGNFDRLTGELKWLKAEGIPFTLSMCVNSGNVDDMPGLVDFASNVGAGNVHFMWYFVGGRGDESGFVHPDRIFEFLTKAVDRAEISGVNIDNIEALKTQVFSPIGTVHDGGTAGWESLAIGPDGCIYPSAALVGTKSLATDIKKDLASAWRDSPVLEQVRKTSVVNLASCLRFIIGGGDIDHSAIHEGTFIGGDPYMSLYEKTALWLISRQARRRDENVTPRLLLKMGDILEGCGANGPVALIHSNCLLTLAQNNSLRVVKEFYGNAAGDARKDVLNPVCYPEDVIDHIPEGFRFRGYGCGSPVMDAHIKKGERVVDLGSGSGVECFIASRLVGKGGEVVGIDMLDSMLDLAQLGARGVSKSLGYENLTFQKGYLEALPLKSDSADVILSNCVINLSINKRHTFHEIYRVLREGGRLVISDVVCINEPDASIRNDETLHGECIAGSMTQRDLVGILEESGFTCIHLIKRFPYRTVNGHPFYSLTYEAFKPIDSERVKVIYRGPFASVSTLDGTVLTPHTIHEIRRHEAEILGDQLFILDDQGTVTNMMLESSCGCFVPLEGIKSMEKKPETIQPLGKTFKLRRRSDCMVCGAPLTYFLEDKSRRCVYCKDFVNANAMCEKGHFVCDACHTESGLDAIEHILMNTRETDMLNLLEKIRAHPAIPLHGPEHHALVPGIILASYKNLGGDIKPSHIKTGIERGAKVAGGNCAFMGACGAAIGTGIAFSLILEATPLTPEKRHLVQTATQKALGRIGALKAARCCQRDSWIALKTAAQVSKKVLPIPLEAEAALVCRQREKNRECMGSACPLLQKGNSSTIKTSMSL